MVLPEGVQVLGLLPTAAPGVFVGRVSQGRARRASQTAWVTSSVTATSLRGGARVMKTEEATLFSCLEAMISSCGAEILIPTGRQDPKFRPAPLGGSPISTPCQARRGDPRTLFSLSGLELGTGSRRGKRTRELCALAQQWSGAVGRVTAVTII